LRQFGDRAGPIRQVHGLSAGIGSGGLGLAVSTPSAQPKRGAGRQWKENRQPLESDSCGSSFRSFGHWLYVSSATPLPAAAAELHDYTVCPTNIQKK
jgi:hypothetical protein